MAGVALLAAAGVLTSVLVIVPGEAATEPQGSQPVPAEYIDTFVEAALSCEALSPARLAGQVMVESQFRTDARTSRSGAGIAGLTDAEWNIWQPAVDAEPDEPAANIFALAHLMCDLVGNVRVAKVPGDPWQLALSAFRLGLDPVRTAGGVPDLARDYVSQVIGHAAWFELTPGFGGSAWPKVTVGPSTTIPPSAPPSPSSPASSAPAPSPSASPRPAPSPPAPVTVATPSPTPAGRFLVGVASRACLSGTGGAGTWVVIWTCDPANPRMYWTMPGDDTIRTNGLCLSTDDPASGLPKLELATCANTPGQRYSRNATTGEIHNIATGKCVDVRQEQNVDGSEVILWECLSQGNQQWTVV